MPTFWDMQPAGLWPTQPSIPPIDPEQGSGWAPSTAAPWESAASTPDFGTPAAPRTAGMPSTAPSFVPPVDRAQATAPGAPAPYRTMDADMAAAQAAREAAAARIGQATQPRGGRQESAGADLPAQFIGGLARSGWKAVTDVPHEARQAFTDQWDALKHHAWIDPGARLQDYLANPSLAKAAQHQWEDFKDGGKSILDLAGLPFAPIQGAARSLIGHPYADLAQLVDSHFNPTGAPNPEQRYDEAKRAVDTALMALGARGGLPLPPMLGSPPASSFLGSRAMPLNDKLKLPPRNLPGNVNGVPYSGHAFDRMQDRGIMPSVVDETITAGVKSPGKTPSELLYYDPVNKIGLCRDIQTGRIVTVYYRGRN